MSKDVFSDLKLTPVKNPKNNLRAYGDVIVQGSIKVKFSVFAGVNGIFAKFPARKGTKPDENGKDIWYPDVSIPNKDLYQEFQALVATEYTNVMGADQGTSTAGEQPQTPQTPTGDNVPF